MRYTSTINNLKCVEWGLTLSQAFLLDILIISDLWAKRETIDGVDYRWVSRNKVLDEIPHAYKTADTVYRSLRDLADKDVIEYKKLGKKDLIRFTEKGKEWVFCQSGFESKLGNKSELHDNSEINPNKLGNKSDNNSDSNPTYNGTNLYNSTSDNDRTHEIEGDVLAVRESNTESIINWQPPTKETMQAQLVMAGANLQMTDGQYQLHVDDFKAYYEQQAQDGKPIKRENLRQSKFRNWLINIAKRNPADKTESVARPHSNRSDAFSSGNEPKLTRQQQIEQNRQAMQQAGLSV